MYATNNAALLNKYQNDSVMTAGPIDLIIMLYDGLSKQIKLGNLFVEQHEYEKANAHLGKAQDIVSELVRALDMRFDISLQLMKLYDYMLNELMMINTTKDVKNVPALLEIVASLRETWVEVKQTGGRKFEIEE